MRKPALPLGALAMGGPPGHLASAACPAITYHVRATVMLRRGPLALVGDVLDCRMAAPPHSVRSMLEGSPGRGPTVFASGVAVTRAGELTPHGCKVRGGDPTVLIGDRAPDPVTVVRRGFVTITVDRRTRTITLSGEQEYHGPGATKGYVRRAVRDINETWSGPTTFEGVPYQVTSNVQGRVREAGAPPDPGASQVYVAHTTDPPDVTARRDPNEQPLYGRATGRQHDNALDDGGHTPAHEFGHAMGLRDRYGTEYGATGERVATTPQAPPDALMATSEPRARPTPDDFHALLTGHGLAP